MSLWGNKEVKAANTGTVEIAANGLVTGTDTLFQTEAVPGDYLVVGANKFIIKTITSNTVASVGASVLGSAVTEIAAGNTFILQNAPKFIAATGGGNAAEVYGIDSTEMGVANSSVVAFTVTNPGSGYFANAVVVVGGNATANAQANSTGRIAAVNLTAAGNTYTSIPTVTIAAPAAVTFQANSTNIQANGFIGIASNKFQVNDVVVYAVADGNTAISPLVSGTTYYVKAANSTGVYLATSIGGTAIELTAGTNETGHSLQGERATAVARIGGGMKHAGAAHAGWVKRTVGTGRRAGRVQYETLVAMGSISGDAEDTVAKDS